MLSAARISENMSPLADISLSTLRPGRTPCDSSLPVAGSPKPPQVEAICADTEAVVPVSAIRWNSWSLQLQQCTKVTSGPSSLR